MRTYVFFRNYFFCMEFDRQQEATVSVCHILELSITLSAYRIKITSLYNNPKSFRQECNERKITVTTDCLDINRLKCIFEDGFFFVLILFFGWNLVVNKKLQFSHSRTINRTKITSSFNYPKSSQLTGMQSAQNNRTFSLSGTLINWSTFWGRFFSYSPFWMEFDRQQKATVSVCRILELSITLLAYRIRIASQSTSVLHLAYWQALPTLYGKIEKTLK